MKSRLSRLEATYTIAGTMIGAGILALPASMAVSGFFPGMVSIVVIGIVSIFTALYLVEALLRTEGELHMPALTEKYLGRIGLIAIFLGIMLYVYGALAGYLSAGGSLIFELTGGAVPFWLGTVLYFTVSTGIVCFGLRITGIAEFFLFSLMIVFVITVMGMTVPHLQPELVLDAEWGALPSIFGVVLFAYAGHVIIPTVARGMKHDARGLATAVITGLLLPMAIYLLWSLVFSMAIPRGEEGAVVPYSETATLFEAKHYGQPATIPLGHLIGGPVVLIGSIFAILSTFTSYLGFGISSIDCWQDLPGRGGGRMGRISALILTMTLPLILALVNPASFLVGIDIGGIYGGSLFAGLIPPLLVLRARKRGTVDSDFSVPGGSVGPILVFLFFAAGVVLRTVQLFQ